jgi:CheY-like chemotaxis protein
MLVSTLTPAVRIEKSLEPKLRPALADTTQTELALLNLAINARDAMPGGGALTISTRNLDETEPARPLDLVGDAAGYIVLTVSDSGVGMTEEVAARAFEPFFTTKGAGKGSGLGLSMVYGLAKQLGGTVTIDSKVGRGTAVAIYIPIATEAVVAPGDAPPAHRTATAASHGAPVLVVDDDAMVRDTTCAALREFGYEVLEAGDGASALQILDSNCAVDVLVTDLVMPGMPGAILALQARKRRPNLPVVLMTGYSDALEPEGLDCPLLQKPFRPAQLAAIVAELSPR